MRTPSPPDFPACWLALLLTTPACGNCGSEAATTAAPAPSATVATETTAKVALLIDGEARDASIGREMRLLSDIVGAKPPASAWVLLTAQTDDGRKVHLEHYGTKYRDHEVRLELDEAGEVRFGVYRQLKDDMPSHVKRALAKPRHALVGVTSVSISTTMPKPPASVEIPVMVGTKQQHITHAQLLKLKKSKPLSRQSGKGSKTSGWHLREVAALLAPVETLKSVVVVDQDAKEHTFDAAQLADTNLFPLARLNRRKKLGLNVFKSGEDNPSLRIREIASLRIELK